MTIDRQAEIALLRNDARTYEELAQAHHDSAIAELLRCHAQRFREQADKLEKEGHEP
jgi:hypothetical protein